MYFNRNKIGITIGLVLIIILLLLFNISTFITGPTNVYAKNDSEITKLILDKNKLSSGKLLYRFSNSIVYYILEIEEKNIIIWCLDDGTIVANKATSTFQPAEVLTEVQKKVELVKPVVQLGYYNNSPVYVIKDQHIEIWCEYDNYQIIWEYRKGLGS